MRPLVFTGLGIGFILMGAALFALACRKPAKPAPANPNKSQQRELAALAEENKKMKTAAGIVVGFGVVLVILTFI